jgi:hypothetical protein
MQETPTVQYIFAPAEPIYHLAASERSTVCGLCVSNAPDQRRRRGDLRIATEKPEGVRALCRKCQGLPDYELAPMELRHCRRSNPNYCDEFIAHMP